MWLWESSVHVLGTVGSRAPHKSFIAYTSMFSSGFGRESADCDVSRRPGQILVFHSLTF